MSCFDPIPTPRCQAPRRCGLCPHQQECIDEEDAAFVRPRRSRFLELAWSVFAAAALWVVVVLAVVAQVVLA